MGPASAADGSLGQGHAEGAERSGGGRGAMQRRAGPPRPAARGPLRKCAILAPVETLRNVQCVQATGYAWLGAYLACGGIAASLGVTKGIDSDGPNPRAAQVAQPTGGRITIPIQFIRRGQARISHTWYIHALAPQHGWSTLPPCITSGPRRPPQPRRARPRPPPCGATACTVQMRPHHQFIVRPP